MDHVLLAIAAFLGSALTLYSGFGLGTVMLPVFALFFPAPAAVAATAVVHLLNNVFKGGLVYRNVDWSVTLRFGLPAVPAAVLGAWLLTWLGELPQLFVVEAFGRSFAPSGAGFTIGILMIVLAALELQPWFQRLQAPARMLPAGGALTGFLGGLSGQQGALRSIFLLKSGLDPRRFIATGVMIAILIDLSRLPAYAAGLSDTAALDESGFVMIAIATLSAFAGAWLGARYMHKVTIGAIRALVAVLMFGIGGLLVAGVLR
jgi:hypothetical protein